AEALLAVEPLHSSLSHVLSFSSMGAGASLTPANCREPTQEKSPAGHKLRGRNTNCEIQRLTIISKISQNPSARWIPGMSKHTARRGISAGRAEEGRGRVLTGFPTYPSSLVDTHEVSLLRLDEGGGVIILRDGLHHVLRRIGGELGVDLRPRAGQGERAGEPMTAGGVPRVVEHPAGGAHRRDGALAQNHRGVAAVVAQGQVMGDEENAKTTFLEIGQEVAHIDAC